MNTEFLDRLLVCNNHAKMLVDIMRQYPLVENRDAILTFEAFEKNIQITKMLIENEIRQQEKENNRVIPPFPSMPETWSQSGIQNC
jgi:hypothetical protein